MQPGQAASVGVLEVDVRRLAVQDPFGRLSQHAFVVRNPAARNERQETYEGSHNHYHADNLLQFGCGNNHGASGDQFGRNTVSAEVINSGPESAMAWRAT